MNIETPNAESGVPEAPEVRRERGWRRGFRWGRRLFRRFRWPLGTGALVGIATLSLSCFSTIRPPADVEDGVVVYFVEAALHSGVVLPADEPGHWVEFGFGEYAWYAEARDAWYRTFATVLWPTRGTLGCRRFTAPNADEVTRKAWADRVTPVVVERAKARALLTRLETLFAEQGEPVYQARYEMSFVPWRRYWILNSCHDATVDWFVELGCSAIWVPVRLGLAVEVQP